MLSGHQQNYFADAVAFVLALIPVAMLVTFVALSYVEDYRRRHAGDRARLSIVPSQVREGQKYSAEHGDERAA